MEPTMGNHFSTPQFGWGGVEFARGSTTYLSPACGEHRERTFGVFTRTENLIREEVIEIG